MNTTKGSDFDLLREDDASRRWAGSPLFGAADTRRDLASASRVIVAAWLAAMVLSSASFSSTTKAPPEVLAVPMEKIIIDTDIGDDIDDAFAVALALPSKELEILRISTAYGDTDVRARIVDWILG